MPVHVARNWGHGCLWLDLANKILFSLLGVSKILCWNIFKLFNLKIELIIRTIHSTHIFGIGSIYKWRLMLGGANWMAQSLSTCHEANLTTKERPWVETVPELRRGRSHGEQGSANGRICFLAVRQPRLYSDRALKMDPRLISRFQSGMSRLRLPVITL